MELIFPPMCYAACSVVLYCPVGPLLTQDPLATPLPPPFCRPRTIAVRPRTPMPIESGVPGPTCLSGRTCCRVAADQAPGATAARPMSASALAAAFADFLLRERVVKRGGRGSGVSEIESTVIYTPESASRIWSPHSVSHYSTLLPFLFLPQALLPLQARLISAL